MTNPIKKWFFELIEDAIGTKAMNQFYKEEEIEIKKNSEPGSDKIDK